MAQNIVFKVSADTTGIKAGMEQAGNATKKVSQNVSSLETQFKSLADSIQNAFSIGSVVEFGKAVYKVSAEIQSLQVRLNSISGGNNQGMVAMQDLSKMANKLGLDFVGLADNFVQFVGAAKASGMEVRKAEQIFKSMSVAIAGSGANAETAKRAMTAMTQMLGKGKISAEELRNQLGEAMPQAFGIMAKSLGVTTQQLDKMMADGKLLANDVLPKFAKEMEKAFGADAQKLAEGMQANVNRLNNAWQNYMATLGERFYGSMGGAQVLADMLEWWTKINLTHEQYMSRETARLLNSSQEKQSAEATLESLKSQGKTLDQLVHSFKVLRDTEMEFAKSIKDTDAKGYVNSVKMAQAYDMILKSVENELALSKVKVPLTEAQIKALEKERKERERIALEMRKALEAGMKMQLEADIEFGTKGEKSKRDFANLLRSDMSGSEIATPFESEMKRLDRLRRRDEINEEEYLNRKLEIQRKYGQNSVETFDQIYALTNKKAQEEKDAKIQFGVDTFNGLSELANTFYQRDLAKQTEALQKRLEVGELSEEQYAEALRQIKRKQMVADKIAAISQIAIATAINVAKASGTLTAPLIPGIIASGTIQAGIVLAQPVPYNKGTKRVPMMRGAIRGKDSVHAILTPDERVVPADINTQPGYSALLDLAQDRKISDKEAGFIAEMAMGGRASSNQPALDPDVIGKAIAKYIPHTSVKINERGIAVITEQSRSEIRRLKSRIG
jgi:tape measure domain-containing protein